MRSSGTNALADAGSPYTFSLPNPVLAGNLVVLFLSYKYSASRTVSITDNIGSNTWTLGPSVDNTTSGQSGTGMTSRCYYSMGTAAGTQTITVTFDAGLNFFQHVTLEYCNVATSSAADGTSTNSTSSAPSISSGSLSTASDGDLILNYARDTSEIDPNPYAAGHNFAAGSGFNFEVADRCRGTVVQSQVQGVHGSINPSITLSSETKTFNSISIAFKSASAGTVRPSGMRIMREYQGFANTASLTLQVPCSGNLLVYATTYGTGTASVSLTDSNSNSYTKKNNTTASPQFLYASPATTSLSMTMSLSLTGTGQNNFCIYDIVGAASPAFDVVTTDVTGSNTSNANISNAPSITPTTAPGIAFGYLAMGIGPVSGSVGTSVINDNTVYPQATDNTAGMESGDGKSHVYYSSTAQINFGWTPNTPSGSLPTAYDSLAIAFTAAPIVAADANIVNVDLAPGTNVAWKYR